MKSVKKHTNLITNNNQKIKPILYRLFGITFLSCINSIVGISYAENNTAFTEVVANTSINNEKTYTQIVEQANLSEVARTLTLNQIKKILSVNKDQTLVSELTENTMQELQSAALLKQLKCIELKPATLIPTTLTETFTKKSSERNCEALSPLTLEHFVVPKTITTPLNELVRNNIIQGYNVKKIKLTQSDTPVNTDQESTLLYGHSSLTHAKQLIALLKLNGLEFTSQLIPKISAFAIRAGWNDINAAEMLEKIRYAQEYDLLFTFENHKEKLNFIPLVNQYAKRDSKNEQGLIIDAWWQPFYRSFVQEENFKQVTRINLFFNGVVCKIKIGF